MTVFDYVLVVLRRAADNGYSWSVSPAEAAALIEEIERLRAEADEMRRWAEEAAHAENLNAQDAQKERAAVVAWLRDSCLEAQEALADRIENGEHRREEER